MSDLRGSSEVYGESIYTRYDRDIAAAAQVWLHEEAPKHAHTPWVLFVSFVAPHFPLTAPAEHFYRYYESEALPWPKQYAAAERPDHPFVTDYARSNDYDRYFESDDAVRRGLAGYWGLCTFLDEQIGKVLGALEATGLDATTRVLYTSDHGDNLGARGLWGKSTMYEEAAKVPLVLAGEDVPAGHTVDEHVSHVDVYPFILECVGERDEHTFTPSHPGVSLAALAAGDTPERTVLSEYHAMGSRTGAFMVRLEQYKYVHYVDYPAQLFDLEADPEELRDVAREPRLAGVIGEARERLGAICDPQAVDRAAKARQRELIRVNGGREAVIARGDLGFSVPPGVEPMFD